MTDAPPSGPARTDEALDRLVGRVLQAGVTLAALIVAVGGALDLVQQGSRPVDYRTFVGGAQGLPDLGTILRQAVALRGEAVITLGLVVLVATPVARVALLAVAFLRAHDRLYACVSALVLAVLILSVVFGGR